MVGGGHRDNQDESTSRQSVSLEEDYGMTSAASNEAHWSKCERKSI